MRQTGSVPVIILVGVLVLVILGLAVRFGGSVLRPKATKPTPVPLFFPTPAPSVLDNSGLPVQNLYFYQLQVSHKPDSPQPPSPLGLYLAGVLGLPKQYQQSLNLGLGLLMYDTRNTDPFKDKYNATYYLVIQNAQSYGVRQGFDLDYNKTYTDSSINIQVSTPSASLLPFMTVNSNYCQTDADCSYIYKYCKLIPSNFYAWYSDQGGCEVANPPSNSQAKCQANQCLGM